jgi:prepilin-type N-terminal cleavage/methylation domain-containing protein
MSTAAKGFTLLELLLVLALITLVGGLLTVPGVLFRDTLAERARLNELVSLIRQARTQAMTESASHILYLTNNDIILKKEDSSGIELVVKTWPWPKEFSLQNNISVGFNAQGHPNQSGTLTLLDKRGRAKYIAVAVGTGRVRVY